jgi:hypothetical protein
VLFVGRQRASSKAIGERMNLEMRNLDGAGVRAVVAIRMENEIVAEITKLHRSVGRRLPASSLERGRMSSLRVWNARARGAADYRSEQHPGPRRTDPHIPKIESLRKDVGRRVLAKVSARELVGSLRMAAGRALRTDDRRRNRESGRRAANALVLELAKSRNRVSRRSLPTKAARNLLSQRRGCTGRALGIAAGTTGHRREQRLDALAAISILSVIASFNGSASAGLLGRCPTCELPGAPRIPTRQSPIPADYRSRADPASRAGSANVLRGARCCEGARVEALAQRLTEKLLGAMRASPNKALGFHSHRARADSAIRATSFTANWTSPLVLGHVQALNALARGEFIRHVPRTSVAQHMRSDREARNARDESACSASAQVPGAVQESFGRARAAMLADASSNIPARRKRFDSRAVSRTAAQQDLPRHSGLPPMLSRAPSSGERVAQSSAIASRIRKQCDLLDAQAKRSHKAGFASCRACARQQARRPPIVQCSPEGTRWRAVRIDLAEQRSRAQAQSVPCPALASTRGSNERAAHQPRTRSTHREFPETPCANSTQGLTATAPRIPATSANTLPSNRAADG